MTLCKNLLISFRIKNRERQKIANACKTNVTGRKLFWFYEALEKQDLSGPLSPQQFVALIEAYFRRFDDELEQIKIKQNIGKKRNNAHASREAVVKMTLEKEIENFNGGGLELPNLCDADEFKKFIDWDGNSYKIQHLKLNFISRNSLLKIQENISDNPNHSQMSVE